MEANTPPADARPLTFADLREMAVRYVNNAEIKLLVDEAIKRRLSGEHSGARYR